MRANDQRMMHLLIYNLQRSHLIRIKYFIPIVDQAIASVNRRFKQYEEVFGFAGLLLIDCNVWMIIVLGRLC
jgi:hypothetical protein